MKTTWIITSALNTGAGVYDAKTRVAQTHETMNSILEFYPDALFVLVEGGKPFDGDAPNFAELRQRCDVFIDLRDDERLAYLHRNIFDTVTIETESGHILGITKSLCELTLMAAATGALANGRMPAALLDVDRIFKISGRYQLSPLFDPKAYEGIGDKYVFLKRQPTWIENALDGVGVDVWFSSRLWSFAPARVEAVAEKVQAMLHDIQELGFRKRVLVDLEHLLFKHFHGEDVIELEHTHVMGNIGPSGRILYD
jgi:hypothetical protein